MRYLAIDLGDRRTGLAMGDDETGIVSALEQLDVPVGPQLDAALERAIEEHGPDALVIGLPLNMDGSEGPRAKSTRAVGDALHDITLLPVHYQDERLTSYAANHAMARSGKTHKQKKKLRDSLAAAEILRDFLGV